LGFRIVGQDEREYHLEYRPAIPKLFSMEWINIKSTCLSVDSAVLSKENYATFAASVKQLMAIP